MDFWHLIVDRVYAFLEIPPTPLNKGGNNLQVPLNKGDLGGSIRCYVCSRLLKTSSQYSLVNIHYSCP
ncbi:MAG: hypothetical protein FWK01_04260 [Pantanalinema sp. GBBB05]|nr:hypothetical protein [Pantanalinema sp. GBBB05]